MPEVHIRTGEAVATVCQLGRSSVHGDKRKDFPGKAHDGTNVIYPLQIVMLGRPSPATQNAILVCYIS